MLTRSGERFSSAGDVPWQDARPFAVELPVTQEEVPDVEGLTPVHVNRMFGRLRSERYISLKQGKLVINDVERLENATGFDAAYLHSAPPQPARER
jgi:CRP-like cAMP-binding protein